MRVTRLILTSIFVLLLVTTANASPCTLVRVPINPITPERTDIFVGKSGSIEVQFNNEYADGNVDIFPNSPLVIKNSESQQICSTDRGVWVKKTVFVSNNGKVVAAQEFRGAKDFLTFYDTGTCKKAKEIDITNSTMTIKGSEISIKSSDSVGKKKRPTLRTYQLDTACIPQKVGDTRSQAKKTPK